MVRSVSVISVVIVSVVGAAFGYAGSYITAPKYRAIAIVSPVTEGMSLVQTISQFGMLGGGVAGLVGLGGGNSPDELSLNLAILRSRAFCETLLADPEFSKFLEAEYRTAGVRPLISRFLGPREVTTTRLCALLDDSIRRISYDARTGLITVSVRSRDSTSAAAWANRMIDALNEHLRRRAIEQLEREIQDLRLEEGRSVSLATQQAITRALESKITAKAIANTRPDFAFAVVDRAVVPERPESPSRLLIAAAAAVMAAFLFVLFDMLNRRGQSNVGD
jgi:uncharacterized protein involved in exopolysaccharide biosynthesis